MTILPLSLPVDAGREVARRLAMPVLVVGLALCVLGYVALAWLVLRALL